MLKNRLFLGLTLIIGIFAACEKPEVYDEAAQYEIDEAKILHWADSTKTKLVKDESGLYYQIITAGSGKDSMGLMDTLTVEYTGRLLTDTVFSEATEENPYKFVLANAIPGWRIGLPKITEGGQIRLLVPSKLAYRNNIVGQVPENAVLHFTIDLKKIVKKK